GAFTRREFFENLGIVLSSVSSAPSYSVFSRSELRPEAVCEFSTFDSMPLDEPQPCDFVIGRIGDTVVEQFDKPFDVEFGSFKFPAWSTRSLAGDRDDNLLLVFHSPLDDESDAEFGMLDFVFDHAALAFQKTSERHHLRSKLEFAERSLDAIRRISSRLGTLELESLLSHLIEVCVTLTDAHVGSVRLTGRAKAEIEWGLPAPALDEIRFPDGRGVTETVLESGEYVLIRDFVGRDDLETLPLFHVGSLLCVPIVSDDRVLGTINLISGPDARVFSEADSIAIQHIGSLAGTAIENAILHRDSLEKQRFEESLKIAQRIQEGMYPEEVPDYPGYDIGWRNASCDETGGDYFDFIPLESGELAVVIGDVSGHGIGAALLMAAGRANLRGLLSVQGELTEIVYRLNNLLERDTPDNKFMTMFVSTIESKSGSFEFVNAGHDSPLVYRAATKDVIRLGTSGLPLGMFKDYQYDPDRGEDLREGDVVLFTTDGVWEAANADRDRYGKERLEALLAELADLPADEIAGRIEADVRSFLGDEEAEDDITLVVVKRQG
ncbi:MAG: GAF domain-containing SpoIIE family protein phosphatase, partial [Planctomycetota bacterium]